MNILDMRTLVLTGIVTELICSAVIVVLWLQTRNRFPGMGLLAAAFVLLTAGWLLIIPHGFIPLFFTAVVSNTLIVAGVFAGYVGMERFVEIQGRQIWNWLLLALFPLCHSYFLFVEPSLNARNINVTAFLAIFFVQYAWLLLHRAEPGIRRFTRWVGAYYGLAYLACCLRIAQLLVHPTRSTDYMRAGGADTLTILIFQIMTILVTYFLVLMITQRLLANIRTQEAKYSKAFHSSPYAIVITRLSDRKVIEVNEGFESISGYLSGEVKDKAIYDTELWDRDENRDAVFQELLRGGTVREREVRFRKKSGEICYGLLSAEITEISGEKCVLSSVNDITERKQAEEKIRHMATHDALTGLPTLRLAQDRLSRVLGAARRSKTTAAVMFIDLDGFKAVNDTLGHDAGDHVLKQVALHLLTCVRESDTVARVGGDEFLIIAGELHASGNAALIAEKIIETVTGPIRIDVREATVSASIGIALFPDHGSDPEQLIKLADGAMYKVKSAGRNGYRFAGTEMAS